MSDKPIINVMRDVNLERNVFMGIHHENLIQHSKKKIRSLGQSIFTYFTEQERQLEREKPCISRSWLMIVKGLKAFKIKTLGAVVNKTDEWDRYA